MTSIPQPSSERETEYKRLQAKSQKIHEVIVTSYLKDELTPFELLTYSVNTFAQSAELFPYAVPVIKQMMREIISMSLDLEAQNKGEEPKKPSGLVNLNGDLL